MIKLIFFAPAEKLIFDQNRQTSAIGLLETVEFGFTEDAPPETMVPFRWAVVVIWHREVEIESPVKYHQQIALVNPVGKEAMKVDFEFEVNNTFTNFRQHADIPFLPAGVSGMYLLKLRLRAENQEEWDEVQTFPIMIRHRLADPATEDVKAESQVDEPVK